MGNEMQIDRETIRLSCEPFRRGPVFKSQPDCLSGNLHSINQRDFLFKLELFFFSRGHLKLITSPRLLYKRGLCGCDYRVWSVRRRLSWHGEGGRPRPRELGQLFVPALRPVNNRALLTAVGLCGCRSAAHGRREQQGWSTGTQKGSISSLVPSSEGTTSCLASSWQVWGQDSALLGHAVSEGWRSQVRACSHLFLHCSGAQAGVFEVFSAQPR